MRSIFRVGGNRIELSPHPKSLARTLSLRAATRFRPPHKGEVKVRAHLFGFVRFGISSVTLQEASRNKFRTPEIDRNTLNKFG